MDQMQLQLVDRSPSLSSDRLAELLSNGLRQAPERLCLLLLSIMAGSLWLRSL